MADRHQIVTSRAPSPVRDSLELVLPLLQSPVDPAHAVDPAAWNQIKRTVPRLGIGPLIAWNARPFLPAEEQVWCQRILGASWVRYEQSMRSLNRIAGLFADEHIEIIALKGPALAARYYDPPFLRRPSSDLDLGVRGADTERAFRILERAGFVPACSVETAKASHHHVGLSHPDGTTVELHFRLSHGALGIETDTCFERAIPYLLPGGAQIRLLEPADEIFHLALHLASDRFSIFFHLYELRKIWREQPEVVRSAVLQKAVEGHFCGVLSLLELAFQYTWGERFLPDGFEVPRTWLGVDADLYLAFESNMLLAQRHDGGSRARGRWLEFRVTDRPVDAARMVVMMSKLGLIRGMQAFSKLFTNRRSHAKIPQ